MAEGRKTTQTVNLEDVLKQMGNFPEKGKLTFLLKLIRKTENGGINLQVSPETALSVYEGRKKIEEKDVEGCLRTYMNLFELAGQDEKVQECQLGYINSLEARGAYGMAGDAAAEFGFEERAQKLYKTQIEKMDEQRKLGEKIDENYYDEMLLNTKRFDLLKPRLEKELENKLRQCDLSGAAYICEILGREEEAKKYKSIDQLTA